MAEIDPITSASTASGIYAIVFRPTGKMYIGSAINMRKRWLQHQNTLKRNCHRNPYLQYAWNKYGPECFCFLELERAEPDRLVEREQDYIDELKACDRDHGFNLCVTAGSQLGMKRSLESRGKMAAAQLGRKQSPESLAKRLDKLRNPSRETRMKISKSLTGRPVSEETRQKISQANRNRSPEERARIAEKISIAHKGKFVSSETRDRISAALTGRHRDMKP